MRTRPSGERGQARSLWRKKGSKGRYSRNFVLLLAAFAPRPLPLPERCLHGQRAAAPGNARRRDAASQHNTVRRRGAVCRWHAGQRPATGHYYRTQHSGAAGGAGVGSRAGEGRGRI